MSEEIPFEKYLTRGPDYHYRQIDKKKLGFFNAYVYARYQIEIKLVKQTLLHIDAKEIKLLDIGCGDGVLIYLLKDCIKNKKLEFFGIDNSDLALKVAKKKNPLVIFKKADVYELPFEENYFDLVISSDVIEHISNPKKMLSEIERVGKNNSYVIIGTPVRYRETPYGKLHIHEFYPKEFEKMLGDYFSNIKIIQSHRLLDFFLYFKNSLILRKRIPLFRYLINILAIYLKKNPFLKIKTSEDDLELFSYMFGIGKIQ